MRKNSRIELLGLISVLFLGSCDPFEAATRGKQVRAFADLQTITAVIEREHTAGTEISEKMIAQAISDLGLEEDVWGNKVLFKVQESGASGASSYIVVSVGSDHRLDVESVSEYFLVQGQKNIHGHASADIVFRDGEPLFLAGK